MRHVARGEPFCGVGEVELVDVGGLVEHSQRRGDEWIPAGLSDGFLWCGRHPEQAGEDLFSAAPSVAEPLDEVVVDGAGEALGGTALGPPERPGRSSAALDIRELGVVGRRHEPTVEDGYLELDL